MAKRSLKASATGIEKAKKAFKQIGWTQDYLAAEVGLQTRQSIWKFFKGSPVERHIFIDICFNLNLDWQEIADIPLEEQAEVKEQKQDHRPDINPLVQKVRSHFYDRIQSQCGTMRLLDVAQPIDLNNIYVSVNILETPSSQQWLDVSNLQDFNQEKFDRFGLGKVAQERVPGLKAVATYPKLMVLGKPGSGKTTFLQKIAIQCNQGKLQPERIPIFIRLKSLTVDVEPDNPTPLLNYIRHQLGSSNISEKQVETLLQRGSALILLDGLDEVPGDDRHQILKQIRHLSENYYKNRFIITCRIAAKQYQLEEFTDIEIADFDFAQIEAFAKKWFVAVGKDFNSGLAKAEQFIEKLKLAENQQVRELSVTPLLLNLTCSVFQAKADFPAKRSELYKQGLDILLTRWDEARGIQRDDLYRNLSLLQKLKLLSMIAAITFEQGHYFFEQSTLQQYITNYLHTLPGSSSDTDALQLASEALLKSIEVQHGLLVERARGIYSFSHLTFQEYLTARSIVANFDPIILSKKLKNLVTHINEPRWREVFLLTAGLLENADEMLQFMKQQVDQMMARDKKLQEFLIWLAEKSAAVDVPYKPAATRAFYLTLALARDFNLARDLNLALALDLSLAGNLAAELNLDLALERVLTLSLTLHENPTLDRVLAVSFALPMQSGFTHDLQLEHQGKERSLSELLQHLKTQLPNPEEGSKKLKAWWVDNGQAWAEELRTVMIQYRRIAHSWQFSDRQQETLRQYYEANQFLLDCLNSNCQITAAIREEIQKNLLLPIAGTKQPNL
ncbi:MAG: NACHT domain-containing NTPase [Aphanothece sp. CMT-3BRIN-NPC111]|jgi:predicted NACHT family NTPase|nr:NACHT domain-containing NTPase [Aphanothece sp. CMT-3BRIN-NPC111]